MSKITERKAIDKVFILLGVAMIAVLLVAGGLAWYGYNFATNSVKTELAEQKIFFPPKDSPAIAALPEADQKEMNKYAGQQLLTGEQAKVYANNFINVHLKKVADGKTYAEVSTEAQKDPTNAKLQGQKTTLFQGETLRGLLLGSGYAYWTFGMIAKYVAIVAFIGAGVMAILVWLGLLHLGKLK
ncbi:MAG TPA: hypothetical protein VJ836_02775 [Candidatus Saccharimonadales bacterium]|nr:hypothetical protein [Candidatus Saccharimonadales bacterium]